MILQNSIIEELNIEKKILIHYCGHNEIQDNLFRSLPLFQSENKLLLSSIFETQK